MSNNPPTLHCGLSEAMNDSLLKTKIQKYVDSIPVRLKYCVNGFITNNENRGVMDFQSAQVLPRQMLQLQ